MHTSSMLKKDEFLKKWIKGLHICCSTNKQMNVMERKEKIKLSADIAMVSAKKTATSWSNALISNARKDQKDTILVNRLLDPESPLKLQNITSCHKSVRCKKILKRVKKKKVGSFRTNSAAVIAKRLVKKRTKVLKRLVPGGESMDEFSLINEALDYILSLKVQVDVMRSVVSATEVLSDGKLLKMVE